MKKKELEKLFTIDERLVNIQSYLKDIKTDVKTNTGSISDINVKIATQSQKLDDHIKYMRNGGTANGHFCLSGFVAKVLKKLIGG